MIKINQKEIYIITNKINNKKYIGQTSSYLSSGRKYGYKQRFNKHKYDSKNKKKSSILHNAINKYGEENFFIELLLKCNKEYIDYYEKKFIFLYDTLYPKGYNIEDGGSLNKNLNLITKKMISKKIKLRYISNNNKKKLIVALKKNNISELPYGINFTSRQNIYEGFTVKNKNKFKNIIANNMTLTEKLKLSLEYLEAIQKSNLEKIKQINNFIENNSKLIIRNSKLHKDAKNTINKLKIDINSIPIHIRYDHRNLRFYVILNNKRKYFSIRNPEKSLKQSILYIFTLQKRKSV